MKIDRSELLEVLKMMVGGNIHDDQIATIADHTIGELVSATIDGRDRPFDGCLFVFRTAMVIDRLHSKNSARHWSASMPMIR